MNRERETRRQLRLGFKFERKPSQLKLGLNMKESPIPHLHTITAIDTNISQMEMFQDIERGTFTYFVGWSELQQQKNSTILNRMTGIGEGEIENQPENQPEKNDSSFPDSSRRNFLDKETTRRDFLIAGGLLGIAVALKSIKTGTFPFANELGNLFKGKSEGEPKDGKMVLGNEETSLRNEMLGYMNYVPDGPITYWTTKDGKRRYLFTGGDMNQEKKWLGNATYMIETDGTKTLKEVIQTGNITADNFRQVYGPDKNVKYRREYAGITGVLQIDKSNKDHLLGIAHCEERTDRNAAGDYTSTIGLTESFDGGLTWEDKGALIKGTDVKAPGGGKVSGAGQPSMVLNEKDGYAYIVYIDWSAKGKHPDQLYLARAKANDNGSLGEVEYYKESGFSAGLEADKQKPVIPVPNGSNLVYIALPHVSWNTEMNQYMCVGESDTGFWMATSPDLLNWSKPEIIYDFEKRGSKPHSILKPGRKWDSYPSALSESEPNSQITDKKGIFYHSSGDNITPHTPAVVDFEIH